jgi:hypothetical protein
VQDLAQLLYQVLDVVACALFAKFTEVGQILADLGRANAQTLAQLLR